MYTDELLAMTPKTSHDRTMLARMSLEQSWYVHRRPYYRVWPSAIDMLQKLDLSKIMCNMVTPLRMPVVITLPESHPLLAGGCEIRSFIVAGVAIGATYGSKVDGEPMPQLMLFAQHTAQDDDRLFLAAAQIKLLGENSSIEECLEAVYTRTKAAKNEVASSVDAMKEIANVCARLYITLCLMGTDDCDLVDRLVMNKHKDKYAKTGDEKYIEAAIRNGINGFDIGRDMHMMPHFRRPHYGFRWCGPGKTELKLRKIKGAIIHRDKIDAIPSGYVDAK